MIEAGLHDRLSRNFCNLLVRNPHIVYPSHIDFSDNSHKKLFEIFNSTNWNSIRFKPPSAEDNDKCFKFEVRPSDIQLTAFENSSVLGFILALYYSVFQFDVNFLMPITKVDENFENAYLEDNIK